MTPWEPGCVGLAPGAERQKLGMRPASGTRTMYSVILDTPVRLRREYFIEAEDAHEAAQIAVDQAEELEAFDYEYIHDVPSLVLGVRALDE